MICPAGIYMHSTKSYLEIHNSVLVTSGTSAARFHPYGRVPVLDAFIWWVILEIQNIEEEGLCKDNAELVCTVEGHSEGCISEEEWKAAYDADEQMKEVKLGILQNWT
ncbi:hypothetical protein NDU88_006262 [Pleurodeles waltl]|uniref:Uncharacterized protein n=1 Tax=Pleurodeles waltl TaxID=8319 RepID=A0AAV7TXB2_PLEWA|nr:hypothetical protein NDU88_006262 [Pleurodeles waltl]